MNVVQFLFTLFLLGVLTWSSFTSNQHFFPSQNDRPQSGPPSVYPFDWMTRIPTNSTCTYNCRGLHFNDKKPGRRLKKAGNVKSLAVTHGSVFLQETHLGPDAGESYLKKILPSGHVPFCSGTGFKSGGVAIILSPDILARFTTRRIGLPSSLDGRAVAVELIPRDLVEDQAQVLVNVHIQAGDNYALKQIQIQALGQSLPVSEYMTLGGDFNFVEDKNADTSSVSRYYDPTDSFLEVWADFKVKYSLREVTQNSHTYFDLSKTLNTAGSSRLDRIYISHSEADWAAVRPYTFIPCIPHSIIHSVCSTTVEEGQTDSGEGVSDHLPVSLSYPPTLTSTETTGPCIPRGIADHPDFAKYFGTRWSSRAIHLDPNRPFDLLDALKDCMYAACADVRADSKAKKKIFSSAVAELTFLVKALRCYQVSTSPTSVSFFKRNPGIGNSDSVRARIGNLLEKAEIEDPDSERHAAASTRKYKPLEKVKLTLPSTRTRLTALRPDLHSDPTSDPDGMSEIAVRCWSTIWAERSRREECVEPEEFFQDYSRTIPSGVMPVLPSLEQVEKAIADSTNSCGGPDGIPFAAWRVIKQHAAPVLHLVLKALCEGILPPDGFNNGLLFLIPKKGTLLPSDTRPISVTNADNRILAKAVVSAITPALLATLHPSQKGFIQGRNFVDHICELNEKFYEMVEEGEEGDNFFILFMDTAKAFDSIDHIFIHEAIRRTGLPPWFSALVRGLLHSAQVKPAFRGAEDRWIQIRRGVKQGCPLSPLLFVICYDILLRQIDDLPDADPFACADDLAVGSLDFKSLWAPMRLVDRFRAASGLGVNQDKTRIVSARPSDISRFLRPTTVPEYMDRCPWRDVMEADVYKYLGLLFGRMVTVPDVYKIALKGLSDRAVAYRPSFRRLAHASRVLAYNTFVITKISYLVNFFHIPFSSRAAACVEGKIKDHARKLVLPVRAAYHYPFLIAPPDRASPGPPIRDAWALSMSTLVDQCDLWQWHGHGATDGSVVVYPDDNLSMRISKHLRSAGADFVCKVTASTGEAFDAGIFDHDTGAARRKVIYRWLIKIDYEEDLNAALQGVLEARSLTHCSHLVPVLHRNFGLLPKKFPPHYRCTQFDLTTNCLFTHRRFRSLDFPAQKDQDPDPDAPAIPPCYFCGRGQDSITHIFGGECEVIVLARRAVPKVLGYYDNSKNKFPTLDTESLQAADFWSASLLAFPRPGAKLGPKSRKRAVFAMTVFNGVAWYERTYHFRLHSCPPELPQAVDRVASMVAIEFLRLTAARPSTGLGSAGRRSEAQKEAARRYARDKINALGSKTLVAFTDGSANPNPGPAGSGAYIYSTTPGDAWDTEAVAALGKGSNNLGELWAIGMALQLALLRITTAPPGSYDTLRIFTDSIFARSCVLGEWNSPKYRVLVEAIQLLLSHLTSIITVGIEWVPAHVGIAANEHADFLAGLGTQRSIAGRTDVNAQEDYQTGDFLPP